MLDRIATAINRAYTDSSIVDHLSKTFLSDGYVKIPSLFSMDYIENLRCELQHLEVCKRNRDFIMPESETIRKMSTIGGKSILQKSQRIVNLYHDTGLRNLIENICGNDVFSCNHESEFMVVNYLERTSETHGWHLDDPAYAMVIFIQSPSPDSGGSLEFSKVANFSKAMLDHVSNGRTEELVVRLRAAGEIERDTHQAGDAYLLRADKCLHRVTPLTQDGERRVALNLAFENMNNQSYGNSANLLYD